MCAIERGDFPPWPGKLGVRAYTLEAQIACVRRELAIRASVYPKWVKSGRMKAESADHEINCMQAVLNTLSALREEKPQP